MKSKIYSKITTIFSLSLCLLSARLWSMESNNTPALALTHEQKQEQLCTLIKGYQEAFLETKEEVQTAQQKLATNILAIFRSDAGFIEASVYGNRDLLQEFLFHKLPYYSLHEKCFINHAMLTEGDQAGHRTVVCHILGHLRQIPSLQRLAYDKIEKISTACIFDLQGRFSQSMRNAFSESATNLGIRLHKIPYLPPLFLIWWAVEQENRLNFNGDRSQTHQISSYLAQYYSEPLLKEAIYGWANRKLKDYYSGNKVTGRDHLNISHYVHWLGYTIQAYAPLTVVPQERLNQLRDAERESEKVKKELEELKNPPRTQEKALNHSFLFMRG